MDDDDDDDVDDGVIPHLNCVIELEVARTQ